MPVLSSILKTIRTISFKNLTLNRYKNSSYRIQNKPIFNKIAHSNMYMQWRNRNSLAHYDFLENGQCDLDFWGPLLLTVDDDEDDDEFERMLWVDEHKLRLVVDTWFPLENMSITQGLWLFLSNDSKNTK